MDKDRDTTGNTRGQGRDNTRRPGAGKSSFDTPIQQSPPADARIRTRIGMTATTSATRDDVKKPVKTGKGAFIMPTPKKEDAKVEEVKTITLPETLTIRELADKMRLQPP